MLSKPITYSIELSHQEMQTIFKLCVRELHMPRLRVGNQAWVLQIKEKMGSDISS